MTFIRDDAIIKANSGLPKRVNLPDEKLRHIVDVDIQKAKEKLHNGLRGVVPKGADLAQVYVMAGKDTSVPIRDLKRLYQTYGRSPQKWQKKSGTCTTDYFRYTIHWYEHDGFIPELEIKLKGVSTSK